MQMDSNRDGLVDFNEFVAATLHVHQLEETDSEKWQMRLQAAFDKFDFDGDGYITANELKIVWNSLFVSFRVLQLWCILESFSWVISTLMASLDSQFFPTFLGMWKC